MKLQILTPDKSVFDGDVEALLVPGAAGPFEILKDHAPILSSLVPGELRIKADRKETFYTVSGGFLEFHANQAVVLAEAVESPQDIDLKRVEAAKQRAVDRLTNPAAAAIDKPRAKRALARATARQRVVEKDKDKSRP
jgi:F-type H+-transporting ATPase subunit epsilon